jgi:hypothetical protein
MTDHHHSVQNPGTRPTGSEPRGDEGRVLYSCLDCDHGDVVVPAEPGISR